MIISSDTTGRAACYRTLILITNLLRDFMRIKNNLEKKLHFQISSASFANLPRIALYNEDERCSTCSDNIVLQVLTKRGAAHVYIALEF